jgi:ribosomal protein L30/L7E
MPIYNIRGHGKTLPLLDVKVGMLRCSLEFADDLTRRNEEVVLNVSPWTMGAIAKLLQVYSETELATILWEPTHDAEYGIARWRGTIQVDRSARRVLAQCSRALRSRSEDRRAHPAGIPLLLR